jgi:AcrR family transcriptional regulator
LFNEHGEPNTTTNQIADEVDISPGNLHYHFHKKSELVEALLAEFQADARRVLEPPTDNRATIADFLAFVHLLHEVLAAYRFLFRDMATLASAYPKTRHALRGFSKALTGTMQLYVEALRRNEQLLIDDKEVGSLCRNRVVLALFSERYDEVCDKAFNADTSALKAVRGTLGMLMPYSSAETKPVLAELTSSYD